MDFLELFQNSLDMPKEVIECGVDFVGSLAQLVEQVLVSTALVTNHN